METFSVFLFVHVITSKFSSLGKDQNASSVKDSWKHCLIMDEVDGMAGNEDRGGVQVQLTV